MMKIGLILAVLALQVSFAGVPDKPQTGEVEYSTLSDTAPVNYIEYAMADSIFHFVKSELDFIEYDDCNNCESRAHLIAAVIEKRFGVRTMKVWLFADSKRATQTDKYKYTPHYKLHLGTKGDCDDWAYHVAVMMIISSNGRTDTIVIDPSLKNSIATISEWAEDIVKDDTRGFIVIKDSMYRLFPDDENGKFEDYKLVWADDEHKDLLDEDYRASISSVLDARYPVSEPWTRSYKEQQILEMLK
jgi:hypothetical protein